MLSHHLAKHSGVWGWGGVFRVSEGHSPSGKGSNLERTNLLLVVQEKILKFHLKLTPIEMESKNINDRVVAPESGLIYLNLS